jgi:hypothetical protein
MYFNPNQLPFTKAQASQEGDTLRWLSRLTWFAGRREEARAALGETTARFSEERFRAASAALFEP